MNSALFPAPFSQGARRNYRPGLKWPCPSPLRAALLASTAAATTTSSSCSLSPPPHHTVGARGRRGTREDGFPLLKYGRGVSNVITLDSCLLCSSTTKSYSALTSKAKLPSVPLPPKPRARAHPHSFSPFLRCNDVRTKNVNKSRRKRGRQWKTPDGRRWMRMKRRRRKGRKEREREKTKTKIK